jgi:hemerythrin-like domain-containing protein
MQIIGILMREHRIIERMLKLMNNIVSSNTINAVFIEQAIDFLRNYADKNHHGKEEDILFKALGAKKLIAEHLKIMHELINEHALGRDLVHKLKIANEKYQQGDKSAVQDIYVNIQALLDLYQKHIEKEDKHFFWSAMNYFNDAEKKELLQLALEFDQKFDHQKYLEMLV